MSESIPCEYCGRYYGHKESCISFVIKTGIGRTMDLMEKIQSLEAQNAELQKQVDRLLKDGKLELSQKDKRITHLEAEVTRLYDPVKKFWNEDLQKKLDEAVKVLNNYANKYAWHGVNTNSEDYWFDEAQGMFLGGKRARDFLKKYGVRE